MQNFHYTSKLPSYTDPKSASIADEIEHELNIYL